MKEEKQEIDGREGVKVVTTKAWLVLKWKAEQTRTR